MEIRSCSGDVAEFAAAPDAISSRILLRNTSSRLLSMQRAQVRICRERATGKIFAMKKLQKSEMVRRGQVDHVKAERNVLTEVRRTPPSCTARRP